MEKSVLLFLLLLSPDTLNDNMINKIYRYPKTQNSYRVINVAILKHPDTREWIDCVVYEEYKKYDINTRSYKFPENDPMVFVREKQDFLSKFESICK